MKYYAVIIFMFTIGINCRSQNSLLWLKKIKGSGITVKCRTYSLKNKEYFPKYRIIINKKNDELKLNKKVIFNRDSFNIYHKVHFELYNDSIIFITPCKINDYTPQHIKREYSILLPVANHNFFYKVILKNKRIYPWSDISIYKNINEIKNTFSVSEINFKEQYIILRKISKNVEELKFPLEKYKNPMF